MKRTSRTLVATDLFEPARHAVDRADLLAAHASGELHIVYALELNALDALDNHACAGLSFMLTATEPYRTLDWLV
jgi:nucleotide-binding universal stress UspA family protein